MKPQNKQLHLCGPRFQLISAALENGLSIFLTKKQNIFYSDVAKARPACGLTRYKCGIRTKVYNSIR